MYLTTQQTNSIIRGSQQVETIRMTAVTTTANELVAPREAGAPILSWCP